MCGVGEPVTKAKRNIQRKSTLLNAIVQIQELNVRRGRGKVSLLGFVVGLKRNDDKDKGRDVRNGPDRAYTWRETVGMHIQHGQYCRE